MADIPDTLKAKLALIAGRVGTAPDALWEWTEGMVAKYGMDPEEALESASSLGQLSSNRGHYFDIAPIFGGVEGWQLVLYKWLSREEGGEYDTVFTLDGFESDDEALTTLIKIIEVIRKDDFDVQITRRQRLKPPEEESSSGDDDGPPF